MDKIELKPCPFCGASAVVFPQVDGITTYYVECEICTATFNLEFLSEEDAVEYWNRRVEP